ncbi:hypothetical protein ME1_00002 [Bartonella vinsonii subsp. arupensis OK-94-513]|uniref:Phage protein n=2 Tax=Bartonella vinsonii subsp. arupensis TaxID=110578 RepID=J1K072_BARVI|nr:hypothetical protein [Bartonella vinsonii]EJF90802.1 hypothetical protein ME1_00002 [Bartonella vinsonii subsp. arupensis OK-94-513]EJF97558.1 hypothetical protein MEI_01252 [Bartonella vinsonii subsp. arupensis Pm136co]
MKQILKLLFTGIVLFTMTGCGSDQAPLTAVDVWEKPGADELEIKKALLECGMPSLSGLSLESYSNTYEKINADASFDACLIQAGFHHRLGAVKWCEKYKADNLPICQPDAVIPQRSVEKRLNSPYCKENTDQPECQP